MSRRNSYAQVASGTTGSSQTNSIPARRGTFSHLVNAAVSNAQSAAHPRHPRSHDADAQHSSMSTSLGRSGPISYASQAGNMNGHGVTQDGPAAAFFVPSYLRGSKHAEKLEEVHKTRAAAQRDFRSTHSSNAGSLSTSSSSINLHKMTSMHRGLANEVIERAPIFVEEPVAPWPTRWDTSILQIEIEDGGRQAKFAGAQKTHDEAASVRADCPMPRQCGIYYYEVTVVSKGKDGMIGVGFCGPRVPLNRIPGWEPDSYAYHGDDGQCFSNTTSGKAYGPKFGTLDVIGCGINFRTNTAFFTKNGQFLKTAFRDLKPNMQYYPTVGMKKTNETLRANFGQEPFAFDIDKMVQAEKAAIQAEITRYTTPSRERPETVSETRFIHELIGQYLAHDGYVDTARAFAEEVRDEAKALNNDEKPDIPYMNTEEDIDATQRQKIRTAILDGEIDKALKHTNAYYPSVLRDNENIYFKLRCRKFIEMIRQCNELKQQYRPGSTPPSKRSTAASTYNNASQQQQQRANRNSTATDEYDFEMELDEQLGVHNGAPWEAAQPEEDEDEEDEDDEAEDEDEAEDREAKHVAMEEKTIVYGQELQAEFLNDPRREVKKALEDTFALIAYENVAKSHLAPLLETAGRMPVAEELNSAILVSLGKSSSAGLERLVQQTEALVNELADDGGPGAFINVRRDFLQ